MDIDDAPDLESYDRDDFEEEHEYREAEFGGDDHLHMDADDLGSAPAHPPPEPKTAQQLFGETLGQGISAKEVNRRFKEELGKVGQQDFKRKARALMDNFEAQLTLYEHAHPEFDAEAYYAQQRKSNRSRASGGQKRTTGRKRTREYAMRDYSEDNVVAPQRKVQRTNNGNSKRNNNDSDKSRTERVFGSLRAKNRFVRKKKGEEGENLAPVDAVPLKDFVDQMRAVAHHDRMAKANGEPALSCMRELDRFVAECSKTALQPTLIEQCHLLDVLGEWLEPFSDGSLPHVKIREELYRLIENLKLHRYDDLKSYFGMSAEHAKDTNSNGFAKTMMELWRHPKETPVNRNKLQTFIQLWIRVLSMTQINYDDMKEHTGLNKAQIQNRNMIIKRQQQLRRSLYDKPDSERKRARVPQAVGFDFAIQPTKRIIEDEVETAAARQGGEGGRAGRASNRNHHMLNKSLQRKSKSARMNGPSLTGRG